MCERLWLLNAIEVLRFLNVDEAFRREIAAVLGIEDVGPAEVLPQPINCIDVRK